MSNVFNLLKNAEVVLSEVEKLLKDYDDNQVSFLPSIEMIRDLYETADQLKDYVEYLHMYYAKVGKP